MPLKPLFVHFENDFVPDDPDMALPHSAILSSNPTEIQRVYIDGSWRVSVEHIELSGVSTSPWIDIMNSQLSVGDHVEVVILERGEFRGKWVKCVILEVVGNNDDILLDVEQLKTICSKYFYNIYVTPTQQYRNAVGFSGREALRISIHHLRKIL